MSVTELALPRTLILYRSISMSIYCPLSEALGIDPGGQSILDIPDYAHDNAIAPHGIRKGILHTDDTKKLMSEKRKGGKPMLGKSHTDETKEKMRVSRKRYLDTDDGKTAKEKWIKSGQLWTEERKQKQCERNQTINRDPEKIRKTAEKHRGMKRSDETRARMSEAKKRYYQSLKNGA